METATNKLSEEVGLPHDDGFLQASDIHYLTRLRDLHNRLQPRTYLEIGTESGASLAFSRCTSIAIDPKFRLEGDVIAQKPALHLHQGTSDEFFATQLLGKLGLKLDLAFLDGMHLFEYLLRDFINTERHMSTRGMIVMHDCLPTNRVMAKRSWDRRETKNWTGDVWKLIPILREYRPDIDVVVRNYAPTGLVEVQGLDPKNTVLSENYKEIVARYLDLTLDASGLTSFFDVADVQAVKIPFVRKKPVSSLKKIAIKTSVPTASETERWGDFHFATGLARAFHRMDIDARIDPMDQWRGRRDDTFDLVLQGHDHYPAGPERPCMNWLIYPGSRFPHESLNRYDHVFSGSDAFMAKIEKRAPGAQVSYLPQAFDADVMTPCEDTERAQAVFVGNNHFRGERPMVSFAHQTGQDIRVWGKGWEETDASRYLVNAQLPNAALAQVYGTATAVLCDHLPQMARNGFVSNRIYDALACAAPVLSDAVVGLPSEFQEMIYIVTSPEEFSEALSAAQNETAEMRARRVDLAHSMRTTDSFDQRAKTIVETAQEKGLL